MVAVTIFMAMVRHKPMRDYYDVCLSIIGFYVELGDLLTRFVVVPNVNKMIVGMVRVRIVVMVTDLVRVGYDITDLMLVFPFR